MNMDRRMFKLRGKQEEVKGATNFLVSTTGGNPSPLERLAEDDGRDFRIVRDIHPHYNVVQLTRYNGEIDRAFIDTAKENTPRNQFDHAERLARQRYDDLYIPQPTRTAVEQRN